MHPASFVVFSLAIAGCNSSPGVSVGFIDPDGKLGLDVYGVAKMATFEVCGVEPNDKNRVLVPLDCVVPADMPLDLTKNVESKPIPIVVKHVLGGRQELAHTATIDTSRQRHLLEAMFNAVAKGVPLPHAKRGGGKPGIGISGYGGVRAIDAKILADIGIVVRVELVNGRDTRETCAYTGVMSGKLKAFDADVEAFDASNGKSLSKIHLANEHPVCPSDNYGAVGEVNTVTSRPGDQLIDAWARKVSL